MIYGFAYLGMVLVISAGWVVLAVFKKPDFIEKPLEELKNKIRPLLNSKKKLNKDHKFLNSFYFKTRTNTPKIKVEAINPTPTNPAIIPVLR